MSKFPRVFRLTSVVSPSDVLSALRLVAGHANQAALEPDFEFDWIKRRLAFSAVSPEGCRALADQFLGQLRKRGDSVAEQFLVGEPAAAGDRWQVPIGVLLQDPATFGELIGRSLVEMGVRGVRVYDAAEQGCHVCVPAGKVLGALEAGAMVADFPLPGYLKLEDLGEREFKPSVAEASGPGSLEPAPAVPRPKRTLSRRRKRG
jgi:hypothetical protein